MDENSKISLYNIILLFGLVISLKIKSGWKALFNVKEVVKQ